MKIFNPCIDASIRRHGELYSNGHAVSLHDRSKADSAAKPRAA